jgi:hypothetical protein
MMVIKVIAAVFVGFGVMAGLQTAGMWQFQRYLKSEAAKSSMPVIGKTPDFSANFKNGIGSVLPKYGPIDTREGQRLAVEGAYRRIDLQNRAALNAVPLPPRIYIPRVR